MFITFISITIDKALSMYSALGAEEFPRCDNILRLATNEGYDENPSTNRQRSLLIHKSSNATLSKHFTRRNVDNSLSRKEFRFVRWNCWFQTISATISYYFVAKLKDRVATTSRSLEISLFRLDALALSVIAMATWLAGWVSVTAGIVSKRLNLSQNFLDHLVGPSFKHLGPLTPIPNSTGNPFIGGVKYTGGGKIGDFC